MNCATTVAVHISYQLIIYDDKLKNIRSKNKNFSNYLYFMCNFVYEYFSLLVLVLPSAGIFYKKYFYPNLVGTKNLKIAAGMNHVMATKTLQLKLNMYFKTSGSINVSPAMYIPSISR